MSAAVTVHARGRRTGTAGAPSPRTKSRLAAILAAAASLPACTGSTAPLDARCAVIPDPAVPLRSGLTASTPVDLQPGEACAVRAEAGGSLRLAAAGGPAEYLVAVQSASQVAGARSALRLTIGAAGAAPAATPDPAAASVPGNEFGTDLELRFRRNVRETLLRRGARPARADVGPAPRASRLPTPLALGDTVVLRNSVDAELGVDCDRSDRVPAVVRAVGQHFAIVEDVEAAGHIDEAAYADVLATLEDPLAPVSEAYFGIPADLDDNGVVLAFVTPIVNRATPRGSATFIAGFFNPSDLSDTESCPASNRGELLYILAPDPDAVFGDEVEIEFATRNIIGVTAHELTHLLTAQQRVTIGGGSFADLEESWLDEGLAHSAELVVGFADAGLVPGGNYTFDQLAADPERFNVFHLPNFRRAGYYMLSPASTLALGDEMGNDPGGTKSLAMRGFAWLFLRWIADQSSFPGGGILGGPNEEDLFRDLSSGGPMRARGVENVERVAGPSTGSAGWRELVARYGMAPLADDTPGNTTTDSQVTSLHLPDIFLGIHEALPENEPFRSPYPLDPARHDLEGGGRSYSFDLFASTSRYFVLSSQAGHGPIELTLTTGSGGGVSSAAEPQIVIQRTR